MRRALEQVVEVHTEEIVAHSVGADNLLPEEDRHLEREIAGIVGTAKELVVEVETQSIAHTCPRIGDIVAGKSRVGNGGADFLEACAKAYLEEETIVLVLIDESTACAISARGERSMGQIVDKRGICPLAIEADEVVLACVLPRAQTISAHKARGVFLGIVRAAPAQEIGLCAISSNTRLRR